MKFREIMPHRKTDIYAANMLDVVRVSFPKIKSSGKHNMNIYIGINIANKFDFKEGDKISFSVEEDNPRIWLLKKATNNVGYKLIGSKTSKNLTSLRLQMTWKEYIPDAQEIPARKVRYDSYSDALIIFS